MVESVLKMTYINGVQLGFPELEVKWLHMSNLEQFWAYQKCSIRRRNFHTFFFSFADAINIIKRGKIASTLSITVLNLIFRPVWVCNLMTVSETHPRHTSQHCNSLLWLHAPIHAENTWKNQMCMGSISFLCFFPLSLCLSLYSLHKHKCTDIHNPPHTHTHTVAHTNTGTTFMPCDLARHYANGQTCHLPEISLRHREREREKEILHICQFVRAPCQV